jgi:hypothetical protein
MTGEFYQLSRSWYGEEVHSTYVRGRHPLHVADDLI